MLGFILSKINLLILVVAIFAIVSFFTFNLIDIVKVYEGRLVLDQLSSKAYSLTSSPAYCFSDAFELPRSIIVGGDEFFYVVKVSTRKIDAQVAADNPQVTVVIFSLIPRKDYLENITEPSKAAAVAASSFRTAAQVNLYSRRYIGESYQMGIEGPGPNEGEIIIDPSTYPEPFNSIEFRKEIRGGKEYVYIFPCSSVSATNIAGNCASIKGEVAVAAGLEGGEFAC